MKFLPQPSHFFLILWLAVISISLGACGGGAPVVRPSDEAGVSTNPIGSDNRDISASRLPESGSLEDASRYLQQAEDAVGAEKQALLTKAARIFLDYGQYSQAQQLYQQIQPQQLDINLAARYQLIGAKLALLAGKSAQAQSAVNRLLNSGIQDPDILGDALELLAENDIQLHNYAAALDHFIEAESYQDSDQAVENLRYRIARLLESLRNSQLSSIAQRTHNAASRAWVELALLYRESAGEPEQLSQNLDSWRQQYPDHPGEQYLSGQFPGGKPARQIALLLPLSSRFGNAANAFKSGFQQMRAADASPQAPSVRIYDIGGIPELASEVYQQAVNEGADFVVGPLGKAAVQSLVDTTQFTVPTLLLGNTNSLPAGSAVYQFGLSPEQEAAQLALHTWLDNKRTALMLYPEGAWGQRAAAAFQNQWDQLGGALLGSAAYRKGQSDYSATIKHLLGMTQSEARKARIARLLGVKLHFRPRNRADVDYIVLFAKPSQARLIKPQLDYYAGLRMPVYSISSIYSGHRSKIRDADLNKLIFGDMPWILGGNRRVSEIRAMLQKAGYTPNQGNRLYALGVDAYQLIPYLSGGLAQPVEMQGVTGRLQLQPDGRFQRWLAWAQFRHGVPQLIDSSFGDESSPDTSTPASQNQ